MIALVHSGPQAVSATVSVPTATGARTFAVGYHQIHPDVSLNYQLNRFCDGSATMLDAMRKVAPKIVDYRDFTRELSTLSREAYREGRLLHGALFLRSAEFFMFPGDPAKDPARRQFMLTMREVFGVAPEAYHEIPYEAARLFAYRFTPPSPKSTIVAFGGFDSYIEELIPTALFLRDSGYDVILFDGPGQGAALEEARLPFTAEWRHPVAAVLDYFHVEDVTLFGYSLGGGLAVRAAAYEPRVSRVVCDDILVSFHSGLLRQLPPAKRRVLDALMTARASTLVNALLGAAMRSSLVIDWGVKQGMHSTGASSPYGFLRAEMLFETMSVSGMVTQDVLLMAGAEDHYVPLEQFSQQLQLLTKARSITARLFTRAEQAQNHVQVGNTGLSLDVIVRWLEGLEARDRSESGLLTPLAKP
jgi:alpha-beta hydrolase superfamily lysophospholipase